MILLDTDTYSLHEYGHERLLERFRTAPESPAISVATQIEVLRGRQDAVFKAENGDRLLRGQRALALTLRHMHQFRVVAFDDAAAAAFDRLIGTKGLKRIGRGDVLVASIALANRATLVSRNMKDFGKVPGLRVENWVD